MGRSKRVNLYVGLQRKFRFMYIIVVIIVISLIIRGTLGYLEEEGLTHIIDNFTEGNIIEKMLEDTIGEI